MIIIISYKAPAAISLSPRPLLSCALSPCLLRKVGFGWQSRRASFFSHPLFRLAFFFFKKIFSLSSFFFSFLLLSFFKGVDSYILRASCSTPHDRRPQKKREQGKEKQCALDEETPSSHPRNLTSAKGDSQNCPGHPSLYPNVIPGRWLPCGIMIGAAFSQGGQGARGCRHDGLSSRRPNKNPYTYKYPPPPMTFPLRIAQPLQMSIVQRRRHSCRRPIASQPCHPCRPDLRTR